VSKLPACEPSRSQKTSSKILTIERLLSGRERAKFPDMSMGGQTFTQATAKAKTGKQKALF
jgi:hypothetical protein